LNDHIFSEAMKYRRRVKSSDPYDLLKFLKAELHWSNVYQEDGLRGYCVVINRTKFVVINDKISDEEKRVVAAHEAAHLILHKADLKSGSLRDVDVFHPGSSLEREANLFAADFLVSDEDVLEIVNQGENDFYKIARELNIPAAFFAFKVYSMVERGYDDLRLPVDLDSTFLK